MSELHIVNGRWGQGRISLGGAVLPIAVMSLDCGEPMSNNDTIPKVELDEVLKKYNSALVSVGGMLLGSNFIFENLPDHTNTFYNGTIGGKSAYIEVGYSDSAYGSAKRYNTRVVVNNETSLYFVNSSFGSGYGTFNKVETFRPMFMIYDEYDSKYVGMTNFSPDLYQEVQSDIPLTSDKIGINGYTNSVPYASIVPNRASCVFEAYVRIDENVTQGLGTITEIVDYPESDPFDEGGESEGHEDEESSGGAGGSGDFDNTSDTVSIPSLPSTSGLNTGFFTAFVCTQAQLQSISTYLWNNLITDILSPSTTIADKIDALKKVVANPYDAIMGCSLVPVTPSTGGSKEVKMYGVVETGIVLPYASSRWAVVDCGSLNIKEYWGAYLDYSPYTKTTSLYLPYIGTVSVDIDLIMKKTVRIVYHVDILTGICIAYILVDGSVKFQYQGHCSTTIPVTNSDYSNAIQSGIGLVGNISNVVSAGATGAMGGGLAGAIMGATSSAISQTPSIVGNVMGMKPDIKSGGGVGSSGGILGVQKPFLIIERPKQSLPKNQNSFTGYPCNVNMRVSDCQGYTEFEMINLDNIALTEDEKTELRDILKGGVYL